MKQSRLFDQTKTGIGDWKEKRQTRSPERVEIMGNQDNGTKAGSTVHLDRLQQAFSLIDEADAVAFLQELIAINSVNPPGNETAVAEAILRRAAAAGLETSIDEVEPERANLFVSLNGADCSADKKVLVYSGHLDTVPTGSIQWQHDPFGGERVGNKVYGRGTTDMKGGVAAMILAMEYLHRAGIELNGSLRFAGTVGEEVDCLGAKAVIARRQLDDATAMVISEPSNNQPFIAHKGALWLELITYGKTAHGSMPEQGVNAIMAMARFIQELNSYAFTYSPHPLLGHPTMNIGVIHGGVKTNVVPDQCSLMLDIRTVPGQSHSAIIQELNELLERVCEPIGARFAIHTANDLPAVTTDPDDPFIQLSLNAAMAFLGREVLAKGVNYYTDGSVYGPHLGIPILIYGPGEPTMAHQPDEWIEVDNYLESIRYYMGLAVSYLGIRSE
ncbi:M20 family metallopeptidase [Brevibacillus ruminantium]|uniref:M20 family metallopeptidase n=1 Tax=Brevibacillus ruminantium TaxID=2950604 RepID=A0ABY4WIQ9_9BACL|nr:M20 family metallopeptidase [Brevibacillus ruminantium]USG66933.1 M20 family metallopeptidase [Brevibacillus ruminantium]